MNDPIINKPIDPRVKKFIIPLLRKRWLYWPPRTNVIRAACIERGNYQCNVCKQTGFTRNSLHVDHISPVQNLETGLNTWYDLLLFIIRLYVDESELQAICSTCHDIKTHTENQMRAFYRKTRKKKK